MWDANAPMTTQRSWKTAAASVGALGIALLAYHQHPNLKGALSGGAFLVLAWRLAFIGVPALNITLGQAYRLNREGSFHWPLAGKLCDIVMGILLLASFLV
jgi:hypothetical protein